MGTKNALSFRQLLARVGPGLLFAGSAIGTSHLVLSTRAGGELGMIVGWIILAALLLKYPFFEFGTRYATSTGKSLLRAYWKQGKWAIGLFSFILAINMFAVTGAVAAVSGGLLNTMIGIPGWSIAWLVGGLMMVTAAILIAGAFPVLDGFIKILSVILLVTVTTAFFAVLQKGPIMPAADFQAPSMWTGAELTLLISLLGWMPAGMDGSIFTSIWVVEQERSSGRRSTLREGLFDFNLGYLFTTLLALLFLTIGAYTVFGSDLKLEGNSTQFSNQLIQLFTEQIGRWTFPILAIAAFGTIYGTLITVWDAFARSLVELVQLYRTGKEAPNATPRGYAWALLLIGLGSFLFFFQFSNQMIRLLQLVTIFSFLTAPIIAWLNLRAVQQLPAEGRPGPVLLLLSLLGLFGMIAFAGYYLWTL